MSIQEITDGIKKILEAPIFKGLFSVVCWGLTKLFGKPDAAMQAFLILLVIDLITGFAKAEMKGVAKSFISHEKGRKKYIGYGIVLITCQLLDVAAVPGIRNISLFWATATEGRSILENCEAMGIPMPAFIRDHLKKTGEKYKF